MNNNIKKIDISFIFITVVIFFIMVMASYNSVAKGEYDTSFHLNYAMNMKFNGVVDFFKLYFYPLWHLAVLFFHKTLGVGSTWAVALTNGFFTILSMVFVHKILLFYLGEKISLLVISLLTLILTLVSAIYFPWYNARLYLGQGTINVYHNPTFIACKPFALASFYIFIRIFETYRLKFEGKKTILMFIAFSLTLVLSVLAKPSFLQFFVFSMGIFLLIQLVCKKINLKFFFAMIISFIPAVVVLFLQSLIVFFSNTSGTVAFSWLTAMKVWSPSPFFSVILFMAFPFFVLLTNIRKVSSNSMYLFSLIAYFVSLIQVLFLIEVGQTAGNFGWAYLLAACLLWVMSIVIFIENYVGSQIKLYTLRMNIGFSLLFLHFICGIYYLFSFIVYAPFL